MGTTETDKKDSPRPNKHHREMKVLQAFSFRAIVEKVNTLGIQKEDIVKVARDNESVILLYYGDTF